MPDWVRDILFALSMIWPCGLAAIALIFALLMLRVYLFRQQRVRYLTRHCLHCQYDLNHNTTGRCPECGKAIQLKQRRYLDRHNT